MDREHWSVDPNDEERAGLAQLSRSPWRADADRARALLWSVQGRSSEQIAQALGERPERVRVWRCYYRRKGFRGCNVALIRADRGSAGHRP